jgi:hypothetical protein
MYSVDVGPKCWVFGDELGVSLDFLRDVLARSYLCESLHDRSMKRACNFSSFLRIIALMDSFTQECQKKSGHSSISIVGINLLCSNRIPASIFSHVFNRYMSFITLSILPATSPAL